VIAAQEVIADTEHVYKRVENGGVDNAVKGWIAV